MLRVSWHNESRKKLWASGDADYTYLESGRIKQGMRRLGHVSGMKTVVERIIFDIVILERHEECHKNLWRYHDTLE